MNPSLHDAASAMGKKGGSTTMKRYGKKHFKKAGNTTLERHGVEHYQEINKISQERKKAIKRAREAGLPTDKTAK